MARREETLKRLLSEFISAKAGLDGKALNSSNDPKGYQRGLLYLMGEAFGVSTGVPRPDDKTLATLNKAIGNMGARIAEMEQKQAQLGQLKAKEQQLNAQASAGASAGASTGEAPGVNVQGGSGVNVQGEGPAIDPAAFSNLTEKDAALFLNRLAKGEDYSKVMADAQSYAKGKNILAQNMMQNTTVKEAPDMSFSEYQWDALNRAAERGASEDELKSMMLRFNMINGYNDPESDLYKSLSDGTMEEYLSGKEKQQKLESQQGIEDALKRYAMPGWMQALQAGALAVGELASFAGNNSQSYRSKLAQAMINAANSGTPGLSAERAAKYGDPRANAGYFGTARALRQQHIGDRNKMLGDTINRVLRGVTGQLGAEQQMQRQYRSLLEARPPGLWYQTNWNFMKNANPSIVSTGGIGNALH